MQIGDETVRAGLQLEVILSLEVSQSSAHACGRYQIDIAPETGWYVCKSYLKDTDLGESCFACQREGWESHPCARHSFYAIFAADMEVEETFSDLASWLEYTKASYATQTGEEARTREDELQAAKEELQTGDQETRTEKDSDQSRISCSKA